VRRRRLLLLASCLFLGLHLASAGLLLYASCEGVVNRVNFERVEVGMPRGRVRQAFGGVGRGVKLL